MLSFTRISNVKQCFFYIMKRLMVPDMVSLFYVYVCLSIVTKYPGIDAIITESGNGAAD